MYPAALSGRGGDLDPILIRIQNFQDISFGQPSEYGAMQTCANTVQVAGIVWGVGTGICVGVAK
jgi:hypothetical protein